MYVSHIIRSPVISALLTAMAALLCTMAIINAALWPYFSWVMLGADYFNGVSRGIAPFIRGGCQDLADARGAASLTMLAFGAAIVAAAVVMCMTAHGPRGKPIDDRKHDWGEEQFTNVSILRVLRVAGLFFALLVSAGAISYFWVRGGELWPNQIASCARTPLGQVAFVSFFGFVALAPLLALLKRVYRFIYDVNRLRRA